MSPNTTRSLLGFNGKQKSIRPGSALGPFDLEGQRSLAQSENLQQYGDILEQRLASRDRLLGGIEDFGDGQRLAINQDFTDALNTSMASLQERGLAGTGLNTTMSLGVERERQRALGGLEDRIMQYRTGLEKGLEEDIAQFQERLTFKGPDANMAVLLGQLLGGQY